MQYYIIIHVGIAKTDDAEDIVMMSLPNALLWQQIYMSGIVRLLILHSNSLTSKIGMFTLVIFIALAT